MDTQLTLTISPIAEVRIEPLLKWPGGKTGELNKILPNLPSQINHYFEPFLGGGAVLFAISEHIPAFVNDKSTDLIGFYECVSTNNAQFFSMLEDIQRNWWALESVVKANEKELVRIYREYATDTLSRSKMTNEIYAFVIAHADQFNGLFSTAFNYDIEHFISEVKKNLVNKIDRMRKIEHERGQLPLNDVLDNIEGALKSAFYMHLRHLYNYADKYQIIPSRYSAIFYFIREHAYAAMFRFNRQGKFNVPYGGISYNRKDMTSKIEKMRSQAVKNRLASATLECMDFNEFFKKHSPSSNDFIFLDPPYDSNFSDYDKNSFGLEDQSRLAQFLLKRCTANFMLVIKATEYILSLYEGQGLNIRSFDKKYMWTIKERNDRDVTHLMITNY